MNIGEIFSQATAWGANIWVQVLLVLIASFIASRIRHYLLNKIEAKLASTSQIWSMSIVEAIRRPAALLIWIAGVSFSIDIIRGAYETPIFESIPPLRIIAVIATLTWFVAKLILSYERRFVAQKVDSKPDFDRTTAEICRQDLPGIGNLYGHPHRHAEPGTEHRRNIGLWRCRGESRSALRPER